MIYTDTDLTFYLIVYQDFDRAVWCLDLVRSAYPGCRIVVDVDGDLDPRWTRLRTLHNAEVRYGKRLFLLKHGGEIVNRMLQLHLKDATKRRWMFRIDTDTEIRRQFNVLPEADYFGTYWPKGKMIQGGCIGLTRDVCQRLVDSKCVERPDLRLPSTWQQGDKTIAERRVRMGLLSLDWMLAWAMQQINVKGTNYPEICSNWRDVVPWDAGVAVAHPCKDIPVERPNI